MGQFGNGIGVAPRTAEDSAMTVNEIMTKDVVTCAPDTDAQTAAELMWQHDCGFLPVVESHGVVTGVITDRDICRAATTRRRAMNHVAVREAMSQPVFACLPDENVKTALVTMGKHQVRRLPVLDKTGHLRGVLSLNDVALAAPRRGGPTSDDIRAALRAICAHRPVAAVTS
jgi:CBS domain-containing protein